MDNELDAITEFAKAMQQLQQAAETEEPVRLSTLHTMLLWEGVKKIVGGDI